MHPGAATSGSPITRVAKLSLFANASFATLRQVSSPSVFVRNCARFRTAPFLALSPVGLVTAIVRLLRDANAPMLFPRD